MKSEAACCPLHGHDWAASLTRIFAQSRYQFVRVEAAGPLLSTPIPFKKEALVRRARRADQAPSKDSSNPN